MFTLDGILGLVGTLDDAPGEDTPRGRFRRFLSESVRNTGELRDYIEARLRTSGPQYDRALQDLVNHAASLVGFGVEFGRYRGIANEVGHDGLWRRGDFAIVAEVKTTDAYVIKTATLLGYIDALVSEGRIADRDHALGLYVVARTDAALGQLTDAIVAGKLTDRLRVATVDTVLTLAELVEGGLIGPDEAVALIRPAGVFVGDTVQLLARIAAKPPDVPDTGTSGDDVALAENESLAPIVPMPLPKQPATPTTSGDRLYLITPVRDEPGKPAKEAIRRLLEAGWYVFGEGTAGRKRIKPGDRLAFYETGVGVVAEAEIASRPERQPPDAPGLVRNPDKFPWSFRVKNPRYFLDAPVVVDAGLRSQLDAFQGRDPSSPWAWFVQGTRYLTRSDFAVLTNRVGPNGDS